MSRWYHRRYQAVVDWEAGVVVVVVLVLGLDGRRMRLRLPLVAVDTAHTIERTRLDACVAKDRSHRRRERRMGS